jgi:DNA-binding transcriptional LysR family regulator
MQIKQLEESVGIDLFETLGKRVFLTEAGQELHHYSKEIQKLLSEAEDVLEGLKGSRHGHLALSVASTANYFATNLLAQFNKRHPEATFSLDVTNRKTLLRQLENNEKDIVIMGRPPVEMDLVTEAFMENPLVLIAPPNHPLIHRKNIPFEELQNETFVVREQGSGTRIAMERYFANKGVTLKTDMEMNSNEAIKQAVQAGLGLGIVSEHTLALELKAKQLVILDAEDFPILRHWYIVYRRGKRLSPIAESFCRFLLDEAKTLLSPNLH